jgi:hypothetical protein
MKTQNCLFGFAISTFLFISTSVSAETKAENATCNQQNPESALFSNIDLPANGRPASGKHFNLTATAKSLADATTISSTLVWKPDLCTPILIGLEQKVTIPTNGISSQQTLVGVAWKNISVTAIGQDGKIGAMASTNFSF